MLSVYRGDITGIHEGIHHRQTVRAALDEIVSELLIAAPRPRIFFSSASAE